MICNVLSNVKARSCQILSVETKYVKEEYSFNSIFQIRIHLHSSKPSFTLGGVSPAGQLRLLHNLPRSSQLGQFVHASTYLCRSHFKALQTMSQWCWSLEISRGILFLSCRDGVGSTHFSSLAWHSVSCYVESAHLFSDMWEAKGPHRTQTSCEWIATAGVISPASNLLSLLCREALGKVENKAKYRMSSACVGHLVLPREFVPMYSSSVATGGSCVSHPGGRVRYPWSGVVI